MPASGARRDSMTASTVLTATVLTVAIVGMLYWARALLIPLALAIFLTFILGPSVNRVRRWGLGRVPAVILVVGLALLVAVATGWIISAQVTALVQDLPNHAEKIRAKVANLGGCEHVVLNPLSWGLEQLELLAGEVLPRVARP